MNFCNFFGLIAKTAEFTRLSQQARGTKKVNLTQAKPDFTLQQERKSYTLTIESVM